MGLSDAAGADGDGAGECFGEDGPGALVDGGGAGGLLGSLCLGGETGAPVRSVGGDGGAESAADSGGGASLLGGSASAQITESTRNRTDIKQKMILHSLAIATETIVENLNVED